MSRQLSARQLNDSSSPCKRESYLMARRFKLIGDCCGLHECERACDVHVLFLVKSDDDLFVWLSDVSDTEGRCSLNRDEERVREL
jgi:hypothetical protein